MAKLTYETAYRELEEITTAIEQDMVPVDVLAEKVKRASVLIAFCQSLLRSTEDEVQNIIRQMEGSGKK